MATIVVIRLLCMCLGDVYTYLCSHCVCTSVACKVLLANVLHFYKLEIASFGGMHAQVL